MATKLPGNWKPTKTRAMEYLICNPGSTMQSIADQVMVSKGTIQNWLKDPEFVEVFYQKYMVTFGAKLPSVLNAMIREAEAGNVQAGRLVLEHSGKLIKRVEVNNMQSPFEKFLDVSGEVVVEVEDADYEDIIALPERPIVQHRSKKKLKTAKDIARTHKLKQEAGRWRVRAKRVGVPAPSNGRQTNIQRQEWLEAIIAKEKEIGI